MTQCTQDSFEFEAHFSRRVTGQFDGGKLTTGGGALLLRQTGQRIGLLRRLGECFTDCRRAERVEHRLDEMLTQRLYGLALGYADLNDHEQLRHDPLLGIAAGKRNPEQALAGKSTLNRMELSPAGDGQKERDWKISYSAAAIDQLMVTLFQESPARSPRRIVLDLDATDTPLHGKQESRFFHGYYNHYCDLPLYIFCGDHLLRARLRPSNIDASAGSLDEVQAVVEQIRERWPKTQMILRADSGFCRDERMSWCEMENRIKEQLILFADRLSSETMRSNQLRLYLSSLAYVLVCALRRLALKGTEWAQAQAETIRLRLLKIAACVTVTTRRIWVSYSSAYAWRSQFEAAFAVLRR